MRNGETTGETNGDETGSSSKKNGENEEKEDEEKYHQFKINPMTQSETGVFNALHASSAMMSDDGFFRGDGF